MTNHASRPRTSLVPPAPSPGRERGLGGEVSSDPTAVLRREAAAGRVLRDGARAQELQQVVRSAGFFSDARQAKAAEGVASDDRAGDAAVDVEVADSELSLHHLDVARVARVEAACERELGVEGKFQGIGYRLDAEDAEDGAEDLVAG